MYQNQNITQYYNDDFDRKMVDRSYKTLINPKFSIERKLTAIEFLSRFVNIKEHRERMEILLEREKHPRIRKHLQKALDGTLFDYISAAFAHFEHIDNLVESEFNAEKEEFKVKSRAELNQNLPFLRYQAKLNTGID